eukprot:11958891-Prorocentrum_lima.AAC.1
MLRGRWGDARGARTYSNDVLAVLTQLFASSADTAQLTARAKALRPHIPLHGPSALNDGWVVGGV